MYDYIIGVDPGLNGAIAILNKDGVLFIVAEMPKVQLIVNKKKVNRIIPELIAPIINNIPLDKACAMIEEVGAMPGQGVTSMFSFGYSAGLIRGVLCALEIPTELVRPAKWQKTFGLTNKDKGDSRNLAIQKWPAHAKEFSRVKDDGKAEACLIAEYYRQSINNK